MQIILHQEEINQCKVFSNRCAETQQAIEFGQRDTKKRSINKIARDNLIGKLAEVGFAKLLKNGYETHVDLDFEYYPRGMWDANDACINGWLVDVKGTRPGAEWLLVEWNKLHFRAKEKKLPHIFVMAIVGWRREDDTPTGSVSMVGFCELDFLTHDSKKAYILRKGRKLPGKNRTLQADNYGVPIRRLNKDWDNLVAKILRRKPPDTSTYPDPWKH